MSTTQTAPRDAAIRSGSPSRESTVTEGLHPHDAPHSRRPRPNRTPSDDEILGLNSGSSSVGALHAVPGEDPWRDVAHSASSAAEESLPANGAAVPSNDAGRSGATPLQLDPADSASPNGSAPEPDNLRATFDANPELRAAWHDAHSYRESFATPDEARAATALLADLDRLDALFFSRRPEDHAELARAVANLDPEAFASLARAMSAHAGSAGFQPANSLADGANRHRRQDAGATNTTDGLGVSPVGAQHAVPGTDSWRSDAHSPGPPAEGLAYRGNGQTQSADRQATDDGDNLVKDDRRTRHVVSLQDQTPRPAPVNAEPRLQSAQIEFFHSTNAAAVRNVLDAIESQVERLLPDGVSKSARNRVVGEIYRELDTTLQSNRQLTQQMRDAFRAAFADASGQGALARPDEGRVGYHQRALVSLITSRARQALPGVAKRVLGEWTSTIVAANHDRRSRQRAAESRVDIAGSGRAGNDGIRPMTPRDLDYARLSDSDILNM